MIKAKWGTKRTCPKCGTRFYDLGKDNPVVCIDCKNEWVPEPLLKSRQPQLEEEKEKEKELETVEEGDEDLDIDEDEEEANPDDDIDLDDGGDDVPEVISKKTSSEDAG